MDEVNPPPNGHGPPPHEGNDADLPALEAVPVEGDPDPQDADDVALEDDDTESVANEDDAPEANQPDVPRGLDFDQQFRMICKARRVIWHEKNEIKIWFQFDLVVREES